MARKEGLNLFPPCMIGLRKCADVQFKWFSIWTKFYLIDQKTMTKIIKFVFKKLAFERNFADVTLACEDDGVTVAKSVFASGNRFFEAEFS